MNTRRYFGTDGIRGRVGEGVISADFVLRLGNAYGHALVAATGAGQEWRKPVVVIGKDTRISNYMFEAALEAGLVAAGVDVQLMGPMPTPAVAHLTHSMRADGGIVISASHNPHHDNGIKFFSAQGEKLDDATELAIEAALDAPFRTVASERLGRAVRTRDTIGRYVEACKNSVPKGFNLRGMRIVVDCANGATYQLAPLVLRELGARLDAIGIDPNGLNINHEVGATAPEALRRAVLEARADCGIALDGDGDRLVMVDAAGTLYDGDQLLYVIARHRARSQPLSGVAGTLMSNLGFEHALGRLGIAVGRAKVGDRYVLEMMQEKGWLFGGENSGHIICLDRHTTGDGIIAALQVLAALRAANETLDQACADLTLYPQKLINVRMPAGFDWVADAGIKSAVKAAEAMLDGSGRVLLRPSGTEPLLRVMVEGREAAMVFDQAEAIAGAVRQAFGE